MSLILLVHQSISNTLPHSTQGYNIFLLKNPYFFFKNAQATLSTTEFFAKKLTKFL